MAAVCFAARIPKLGPDSWHHPTLSHLLSIYLMSIKAIWMHEFSDSTITFPRPNLPAPPATIESLPGGTTEVNLPPVDVSEVMHFE
jgi:hypothetical protein